MSKREKVMVMILFIFVSMFLFYQFLLNPKNLEYDNLKKENETLQLRAEKVKGEIGKVKDNEERIKDIRNELEKLSVHLFELYEEEDIGIVLYELISKSEINVNSITISPTTVEQIISIGNSGEERPLSTIENSYSKVINNFEDNTDSLNREDSSEVSEDKIQEITVPKIGVAMNFNGEYRSIVKFISDIEKYEKKFLIRNIVLNSVKGEFNELSGSIVMDAYLLPLPKMIDENIFIPEGKRDNPFTSISDDNTKLDFINRIPDIFMVLKPTSADIDSMIIGLNNNAEESSIDFDSENFEECSIHLKEESGKIFINYKLGDSSYPKEGFTEIKPNTNGIISMRVLSSLRNRNDENGVNVKIINETSYKFIYNVLGDDMEKPRFVIAEKKGNVEEE